MKFKEVSIKDIVDLKQWKNLPISKLTKEGYSVYGANGIIGYYHEYNHEYPTLAITCRGATCGNIHLTVPKSYITSNAMALDNLNIEKIDIHYLKYFLRARGFSDVITGSAQPQIVRKNLEKIKIFIPESLEEQKKIANLLTQVESLMAKREESIELLDELLRSCFLDMFGKDINNTQKHPVVNLSEVSNKITDGTHQSPKFLNSGIPFLLVSNIKNNEITYTTQKYISNEEYERLSKRTPIEIGNILLTTVGSYGNPAIIKNTKKFAFQRHIAFIQPNHEIVNYYYLFAMLKSPIVKHQIEKKVKGVAQKTLNLKDLKAIKIWLPNRSLQDKFATIVQEVEKTKKKYQYSLDELRDLFGSLSQRAFKGELEMDINKRS